MTEHSNSTYNQHRTTPTSDVPAPKLYGDLPRARPKFADPAAEADAVTETADGYVVAARGPYAGVVRFDLAAPAALFHVVEYDPADGHDHDEGDHATEAGRYVEARHRDVGISDEIADRMADHFALFYDLDHPAVKPGTLIGIYEDLSEPHHGGGHLTEAFGVLGPAAALDTPESGAALAERDREHSDRREAAADLAAALDRDPWSGEAREAWEQARADRRGE